MKRFIFFICILGLSSCSNDSDTMSGPDLTSDPVLATFSSIQSKVFTPTCALSGCHGGGQLPSLRAGSAYGNIVNRPSSQGLDYIEPGDPNNSYLFRKLTGSNIVGSRMPEGRGALASATIDSIRSWIEKGAPNN